MLILRPPRARLRDWRTCIHITISPSDYIKSSNLGAFEVLNWSFSSVYIWHFRNILTTKKRQCLLVSLLGLDLSQVELKLFAFEDVSVGTAWLSGSGGDGGKDTTGHELILKGVLDLKRNHTWHEDTSQWIRNVSFSKDLCFKSKDQVKAL